MEPRHRGDYTDAATHEYLQYMADAGFVAASIQYDNDTDVSGAELVQKARCIFDAANPNSAINKLDALAVVDVSKGIFASGLSQGSLMAHLSRDFHSQVRGAWLSGTGDTGSLPCTSRSSTTRIRLSRTSEPRMVSKTRFSVQATALGIWRPATPSN
ncbi:hypothetical protein D3872_24310 [Massilia cavernae]|uniref:Uncharacterized protein n=1 Tax=Massilia cavernae TaxID=2320864 RepID=A0A418X7C9_9BURK|nr:hypothetical protein D3872_24310 [Massilia cavernae]